MLPPRPVVSGGHWAFPSLPGRTRGHWGLVGPGQEAARRRLLSAPSRDVRWPIGTFYGSALIRAVRESRGFGDSRKDREPDSAVSGVILISSVAQDRRKGRVRITFPMGTSHPSVGGDARLAHRESSSPAGRTHAAAPGDASCLAANTRVPVASLALTSQCTGHRLDRSEARPQGLRSKSHPPCAPRPLLCADAGLASGTFRPMGGKEVTPSGCTLRWP